jgi:small subunit ribosomal protein S8
MDPIANMIVQIKNAGAAGRESVLLPYSKVKENIAKVLVKEGFLKGVEKKSHKGHPALSLDLIVDNRNPKVTGVKRISKNSKRIYKKSSEIRPIKNGYGLLILSTPKGIMSGRDARKEKLGGEVLFSIW